MIPFVKSSESYRNALNCESSVRFSRTTTSLSTSVLVPIVVGSRTFQEAMMDVQYHFPHGLCCDAESVPYFSQEYKVRYHVEILCAFFVKIVLSILYALKLDKELCKKTHCANYYIQQHACTYECTCGCTDVGVYTVHTQFN